MPNGGLVLPPNVTTTAHRDVIVALAARHLAGPIGPSLIALAAALLINLFAPSRDDFLLGGKPAYMGEG